MTVGGRFTLLPTYNLPVSKNLILVDICNYRIANWILVIGLLGLPNIKAEQSSAPPSSDNAKDSNHHLVAGKALGAEGKWAEAERELRSYRNQHPEQTNAIVLHAEALIKINQPFDAALELQEFLRQHPEALRAHELYAVLAASSLRDSTLAASELEECVRLAPKDFQAWESLGDLYLDQAKPENAIRAYTAALRLKPNDPIAISALAHAYAEGGLTEKASAQFKRAIELSTNGPRSAQTSAVVQYLYGTYLAEQGRAIESIAALTRALDFNPHSADAHYWRARAYEKVNDVANAEADALESIRLSPSSKEAPLFLITLYRKSGNMENAQKYADLAQKISDREQSEATFGRALRDALDKAEPLLREGRFAEATPQYESIVRLLPTFYEAYFDLGMCYSQTAHSAEAEAAFRKYLSFQPVSADGHAALGILLLTQGRKQEAIPELTQAIQIDPNLIEARKVLANEYLERGNSKEAVSILRSESKGTDIQLKVMLAKALGQSGEVQAALAEVNSALMTEPNNRVALKLRNELLGQRNGK